jgi:uncharacterized protein (DUF4415 family)
MKVPKWAKTGCRNQSSTTVRLDTDVLRWLKSKGKSYQTRLNAILREAMLKELNKG